MLERILVADVGLLGETAADTASAAGDAHGPDPTARAGQADLEGDVDVDGEITAYQYVLDPWESAYRVCQVDEGSECTSEVYADISPTGPDSIPSYHEFRLRAQDNAGCWEESWNIVRFYVKECD